MSRLRTVTVGLVSTALAAGGLAMGAATSATASPHAVAKAGVTVKTRHASLGTFLVGPSGRTLYLFEKDEGTGKSNCYHTCAKVWPPLITHGRPVAGGKVKAGKLGTIRRKNGKRQVTYNGHPLYYYSADSRHSTRGEGLDQFGAEWYVVNPKGNKIDES